MPAFVLQHLPWFIAGLIVVIVLLYGLRDVLRFSLKRTWAISSVNFAESIRRRVLWITPLAILGVIIVSQLQKPVDEQDAIRQTTKFCLFASGLLVTVTAIILACTNLPREIESRVIYTVVTKPTTRLEIIVGKILGFARVSATILIIMGVFTYGYLKIREWSLQKFIDQRLQTNAVDQLNRPTLEHYKHAGLLSARVYENADDLQVYSRPPDPSDERRWMFGAAEGQFLVPFYVPDEWRTQNPPPLAIEVSVGFEPSNFLPEDPVDSAPPTTLPYYIQDPKATPEEVIIRGKPKVDKTPAVSIELLDSNFNALVGSTFINNGREIRLPDPEGKRPVIAELSPEGIHQLVGRGGLFFVQVTGVTMNQEFFARQTPVFVLSDTQRQRLEPLYDNRRKTTALPRFQTRTGTYGMQLRGGEGKVPMAVYKFRDVQTSPSADGQVQFELRVGIERESGDNEDQPTELDVTILNRTAGATPSAPVKVYPETNRTAYFSLPASSISEKDFDVLISCRSNDQYVGVTPRSLLMITATQPFAFNLVKSLLVLWLMSILVVIVSIFASTFLSWPIAIVLTVLILLGHWGVKQLGDATAPGIGNLVVTDLFKTPDANVAKTISTSVEVLAKFLNAVTSVLPDISKFSALEDLEAGIALPKQRLSDALQVLAIFGLPMTVLAYVLLRQKEVAP
jgi:ABC-type transport system involved in multi-copper enzyme maturation permease subunit